MGIIMGNTNQKGGDTIFIQNNIEKFIQQIMEKNLDNPLNRDFCKNIQITIKDEILDKLTKNQLLEKNSKYTIGISLNDQNTKKEICDELSLYYIKKIEILSTIKYLLDLISNKISNFNTNSRCYSSNNSLSRIKFGESKFWQTIPNAIKKNIDLSAIRMNMFSETNLDPSEFYYVNELDNSNDCKKNGGRWIKGIEQLKNLNLVPDDKIKDY